MTASFCAQCLELQLNIWVDRVGTDDNVADLPSRLDFAALEVCLRDQCARKCL